MLMMGQDVTKINMAVKGYRSIGLKIRASLTFIVHFFHTSISSSIHVLLSFLGVSDSLGLGDKMI